MRVVIILFVLFMNSIPVLSQETVSVDPLTGKPQIFIPFWELRHGGLSVPVGIRHHGNAIKMTESEGSAGMGWNLMAGGGVFRSVYGLPDDYPGSASDSRQGWLFNNNAQTITNFSPTADDNLDVCTDEATDYNFIQALGYTKDSEPDVFTFNAPGLSGEFVFDATGTPRLTVYQDLKITPTRNAAGEIDLFTITDNRGFVYTFSVEIVSVRRAFHCKDNIIPANFKRDYNYYRNPVQYASAWYLSSITSPGGVTASFSYTPGKEADHTDFRDIINESNAVDTLYCMSETTTSSNVTGIQMGGQSVTLTWTDNLLQKIKIQEAAYNDAKEISFTYQVVVCNVPYDNRPLARLHFLKEIQQQGSCTPFPSYKMEYESLSTVASEKAFNQKNEQDLWGFYNGQSTLNIPAIYVYNASSDAERFRTEVITGSTPSSTLSGDDRQVNTLAVFGALSSVQYPSGGIVKIEYESNDYHDAVVNASVKSGGVRVKKITTSGMETTLETASRTQWKSIVKTYEYKTSSGKSSGKILYRPAFAFATGSVIMRTPGYLNEDAEIMYARVTEITDRKGKIVYEYAVPAAYPATTDGDWQATKSRVVRKPGTACSAGNLKNGYYTFPFARNANYEFERGLLSRVTEYSQTNVIVKQHGYAYTRLASSEPAIKGLKFEPVGDSFHYGFYTISPGLTKVLTSDTVRIADEVTASLLSESVTNYAYNTTHKLLESITTKNSEGSVFKTRFKYVKDYADIVTPSGEAADALKKLNVSNQHGVVVESISSKTPAGSSTPIIIGSVLNLFKDFGSGKVLLSQQLNFPEGATFTESATNNSGGVQSFVSDADYIAGISYLSYDADGNPVDVTDIRKTKLASHYGYGKQFAVASVKNAVADQTVYEGFETTTGNGLTATAITNVTGWTGLKAAALTTSSLLSRSDVKKGGNSYRVACWAKASAAVNVTFKILNGSTTVTTKVLTYNTSALNTWQYLEAFADITAAPATFNLQVIASANVQVDDVVFIPAGALISTKTFRPLYGPSSESDDRGVSATLEYDPMGRPSKRYDRNRNLVELKEYQYQVQPVAKVNAYFQYSPGSNIKRGNTVTFTAGENCISPLTYQWKINGVAVSTASTFPYTFNNSGNQVVELTVTNPSYGSQSYSLDLCVEPVYTFQLSAQGGTTIDGCDSNYIKNFSVTNIQGCSNAVKTQYEWYFLTLSGTWQSFGQDQANVSFDIQDYGTPRSYSVKCIVTNQCGDGVACNSINDQVTVVEHTVAITFIPRDPTECP